MLNLRRNDGHYDIYWQVFVYNNQYIQEERVELLYLTIWQLQNAYTRAKHVSKDIKVEEE